MSFLRKRVIPCALLAACFIANVHAEKADQDKPVVLEAEKVSVNDVQQVYELDGQVLLTKGSILITGEKGNIKVDAEGYEYVDVQGNPELTASLKRLHNMQMLDQLHGWKIDYDDVLQRYKVTPPPNAKAEDLPLAKAILSPRRKATLEK